MVVWVQGCGVKTMVQVLVAHSWSCQSVADFGVVHPVLVLNLFLSSQVNSHNDHMLLKITQ